MAVVSQNLGAVNGTITDESGYLLICFSVILVAMIVSFDVVSAKGTLRNVNYVFGDVHSGDMVEIAAARTRLIVPFLYVLSFVAYFYNPMVSLFLLVATIGMLAISTLIILRTQALSRVRDNVSMQRIKDDNLDFVVFFATNKPTYGVYMMWDKYFKRAGRRFAIITQQEQHVMPLSKQTDTPVIYARRAEDLRTILMLKSIRAVFYPTNNNRNMTTTISPGPLHVHIGHGDSDKASSYRFTNNMYDRIFVAGNAAIERYVGHGVHIDSNKFVVVGRPQIEDVQVAVNNDIKTVLYAPTWHGDTSEMNYTSLYEGVHIVKALLSRGLRVIFRPHPQSRRSSTLSTHIDRVLDILKDNERETGVRHVYGHTAEVTMGVSDCFNESDALISDVSSVVSDYLFSEKPIILVSARESAAEFKKEYPIAKAAYVVEPDMVGLGGVLDRLVKSNDPMKVKRKQVKEHYLGSVKVGKDYTSLFTEEVINVVNAPNPRR
ncbi:MAG: CDP-glycerol glycerophosphotransferase family protein [Candidatus Saccharimonadales bacterium]